MKMNGNGYDSKLFQIKVNELLTIPDVSSDTYEVFAVLSNKYVTTISAKTTVGQPVELNVISNYAL